MATIAINSAARVSPMAWASFAVQSVKDAWIRRSAYNRVYAELSILTDRELADIGVSRGDFRQIALQASAAA